MENIENKEELLLKKIEEACMQKRKFVLERIKEVDQSSSEAMWLDGVSDAITNVLDLIKEERKIDPEERKIGPNDLESTVDLMCSTDYKKRFIAEYAQLRIRTEKLKIFIFKIITNKETPHDCSIDLLKLQYTYMCSYLNVLKDRAKIEGIELI